MAKNFDKVMQKIKRELKQIESKSKDPSLLKPLGDKIVEKIKMRTRAGFGVAKPGGKQSKLAPLKKSYKDWRKKQKLPPETAWNRSNLTLTGEMLDSIKARIVRGKILPTFTGMNNRKKSKYAREGSKHRAKRIFLNLSDNEKKFISKWYKKIITALVLRKLKK